MKLRFNIPLHIQILIALAGGAIFGTLFRVNPSALNIKILDNFSKEKIVKINNWKNIIIKNKSIGNAADESLVVFGKNDQIRLINYFKNKIKDKDNTYFEVIYDTKSIPEIYINVLDVDKVETIATQIKPIGNLFIRLLSFLAIPLVIASLIVGASSLEDIKKLGRIGIKTFVFYISTTFLAVAIGLTIANVIVPGERLSEYAKNRLMSTFQTESIERATVNVGVDILDFFLNIVPSNPFEAMSNGNMLQIVFFAVLFGITLLFIDKNKSAPIVNFFSGISDAMIKMVGFIMRIAPYGVFALISATIADFGFEIISTLLWYIISVLVGLLLHTIGVYTFLVKFFGKIKAGYFYKGMRNAQAIAFSTSSSAATLPVTFECVGKNLGVPKQISGFVLPLGATINMDGTALYQGVAAVFIAQVYGFDLHLTEQLTIVLTAVLASIGTAPVPGVGIIMLVMILRSINIPAEGIALILGVDRILDMCRTITNITGDAAVSVAVAGSERRLAKVV